jgi:hypothetical protein
MGQLQALPGQGYSYHLASSKNNQAGEQRPENLKPIVGRAAQALRAWLQASGVREGAIFRRVTKTGRVLGPLPDKAVATIVKQRCALAGVEGDFSAHSLRSGFITEAGRANIPIPEGMAMSSHKSVKTFLGYYQAGHLASSRAARLLDEGGCPGPSPHGAPRAQHPPIKKERTPPHTGPHRRQGKLATELLAELRSQDGLSIQPWRGARRRGRGIVVHADRAARSKPSRPLRAQRLHPGGAVHRLGAGAAGEPGFPVLLCPNTNILMLKFMHMLARSGRLFAGTPVRLIESHQASKHSVPGTAVQMAQALGLPAQSIESVRDPARQATEFHIPPEHLARHAFHRISLEDGPARSRSRPGCWAARPMPAGCRRSLARWPAGPCRPVCRLSPS